MRNPSKNPKIQTESELKQELERLADSNELITFEGRISRGWLERKIKFVHDSLSNFAEIPEYEWCREAVDEFEDELIEKEGSIENINFKYGTPRKLKALLEHLEKEKNWHEIPAKDQGSHDGKLGHLNIQLLTKDYGFPKNFHTNSEWQWAIDLLTEFNEKMYEKGALGTTWERKVPFLRKKLEKLNNEKALPVNQNGELNKTEIMMKYLNIADNVSVDVLCRRGPKLRELFNEYDQKLKDRGVTQFSGDRVASKLEKLIQEKNYKLNKDKLTICRPDLAKKLKITEGYFYHTESLRTQIKEEEKVIFNNCLTGKTKGTFYIYETKYINTGITPFNVHHDRVFDFSELTDEYELETTERIATTFNTVVKMVKSPKTWFSTIKKFLKYISEQKDKSKEISNVFECINSNQDISELDFNFTFKSFKEEYKKTSSINMGVIREYGKAGIFPSPSNNS